MTDILPLLLLAALIFGGSGLALAVLRPRPRELRLPREDGLDLPEVSEPPGGPETIDLDAKEISSVPPHDRGE